MRRALLFLYLILFSSLAVRAQIQIDRRCEEWADSVMRRMSLKERLCQLFIYTIAPTQDKANLALLHKVVDEYHVGGLLFSGGTLQGQVALMNDAQRRTRVPLMITFDGEWGLAMRLKGTPTFPKNSALGDIEDNSLIYEYGREMARQCRELGVQVNFAPVADVNLCADNPVIGNRSFGDRPQTVAEKVVAYARGLEDGGVLSVCKHFPGHGDTNVDSHKALPTLPFSRARLDSIELYPFRRAIAAGVGGIMVGHLEVPVLEPQKGLPASLSQKVVTGLLKEELGFRGLVFTDALAMKGVSGNQDLCLQALLAGHDLLLVPRRIKEEVETIMSAIESGTLPESEINSRCRKVLMYKCALGLSKCPHTQLSGLEQRLNTPATRDLIERLNRAVTEASSPRNLVASSPDSHGMNPKALAEIDRIAGEGISEGAYPGCQVVVLKDGAEVYNKAFGTHAWQNTGARSRTVKPTDLYDLASLTKTTATLLAVMKLYDTGRLNVADRASQYLPYLRGTNKQHITLRELLLHESGLPSTILFYQQAIDEESYTGTLFRSRTDALHPVRIARQTWANPHFRFREGLTSKTPTADHTMQVCDSLWLHRDFKQEYLQKIVDAPLLSRRYRYSCVGFILLQQVVEAITSMPMDEFLTREFYRPMGLRRTGYLPLRFAKREEIVPSAVDKFLRKATLQGYVHDESAAFQGGVSGNAGLFSTATEVARVYQMILDGGQLDGRRYLSPETCRFFTTTLSRTSRRGLGFDKPDRTDPTKGPCSESAPRSVYGHTGFTGTCAWVDPDSRLVYVFLCNRTYPNPWNSKLMQLDIRTRIQEALYKALQKQ